MEQVGQAGFLGRDKQGFGVGWAIPRITEESEELQQGSRLRQKNC
jgi:hypothetical protein